MNHNADAWNRVVGADDTVFHLGDFCLGGAAEWTKVLDRLNSFTPVSFGQVNQIIKKQLDK